MFFIGQSLNHVHITHSFLELLIFFWLTLSWRRRYHIETSPLICGASELTQVDIYCLEFISHHITEILYLNTNSKGNQSWNQNKQFHLFLSWKKTNIFTCFFRVTGQLPPVIVGVWVKVRVSFRVGGNQTIVPEENCPRLGLGFGLGLVLGLGAIFLYTPWV